MDSDTDKSAAEGHETVMAQQFLRAVDHLNEFALDRGYKAISLNQQLSTWEATVRELRDGDAAYSPFTIREAEEVLTGIRQRLNALAAEIRRDLAANAIRVDA